MKNVIGIDIGGDSAKWMISHGGCGTQATLMARQKEGDTLLIGDSAADPDKDYFIQEVLPPICKGVPEMKGGVAGRVEVFYDNLREFLFFLKSKMGIGMSDYGNRVIVSLPHSCFRWVKAKDNQPSHYVPNDVAKTVESLAKEVFGEAEVVSEVLASLASISHTSGLKKGIVVDVGFDTIQIYFYMGTMPEESQIAVHFGGVRKAMTQVRAKIQEHFGDEEIITFNEVRKMFCSKATTNGVSALVYDFGIGGAEDKHDIKDIIIPASREMVEVIVGRLKAIIKGLTRPTLNAFVKGGVFNKVLLVGGGSQIKGIEKCLLSQLTKLTNEELLGRISEVEAISADRYLYLIAKGCLLIGGRCK